MRRVKCDETPGACEKCTSTGRSCDYDLQRLPRGAKGPNRHRGVENRNFSFMEIAEGLPWAVTSDERRCFFHFQCQTVPTLLEFFDSLLWQRLVLKMASSEPAVYHAVVALSAVHQDLEMHGLVLPGTKLLNIRYRFALEQCGRSFAILGRRSASRDPCLKEVMLVCCLLFVVICLLRTQYIDAFHHLQSGLRILEEIKIQRHQHEKLCLEPGLIRAFEHLESHSLRYGMAQIRQIDEKGPIGDNQSVFDSVEDARLGFHPIACAVFRFVDQCICLSEAYIGSNYGVLHSKQMRLLSTLGRFGSSFESFCSNRNFNHKEQRGADILRLLHRSLTLSTTACMVKSESIIEGYTFEYRTQLSMVEDIMARYSERPIFILENGIIPTLFFAALRCRDLDVRYHAVKLLRSWPHREGTFDSNWVALLSLESMRAQGLMPKNSSYTIEDVIRADQSITTRLREIREALIRNSVKKDSPCHNFTN